MARSWIWILYLASSLGALTTLALNVTAARPFRPEFKPDWVYGLIFLWSISPYLLLAFLTAVFKVRRLASAIIVLGGLVMVIGSVFFYGHTFWTTHSSQEGMLFIYVPLYQLEFTILLALAAWASGDPVFQKASRPTFVKHSRRHVLAAAGRAFPDQALDEVMNVLDQFGHDVSKAEQARVQLAIVKLSAGDLEKMKYWTRQSLADSSQVLSQADNPPSGGESTVTPDEPQPGPDQDPVS